VCMCVCSSQFSSQLMNNVETGDSVCVCVFVTDYVFTCVACYCISMHHSVPRQILGGFNGVTW